MGIKAYPYKFNQCDILILRVLFYSMPKLLVVHGHCWQIPECILAPVMFVSWITQRAPDMGVLVKKSTGCVVCLAAASSVRQGLYWLRRRLKLIGKETEITESLQLKLCPYSCILVIMHSAQSRYYYHSATQHIQPCWKQTCSFLKDNFP